MRLKLTAPLRSRDGTLNKGAKMKNAVAEILGKVLRLVKRPGIATSSFLPAGQAQGLVWLNGTLYAAVGDKLYYLPDATGEYTGGMDLATGVAFGPSSGDSNFAISPGPTYPTAQDDYLVPPYAYPANLKDYATIDAIVAVMNAHHGGVGVWSFSAYAPIASGFSNYPTFIGYVWANLGADDAYVEVLQG